MVRNPTLVTSLVLLGGVFAALSAQPGSAQPGPPLFSTSLPKEEFAARRAKVLQKIGDGVAVMQGATETSSYEKFRQNNQFYYLTGVETPRAVLVIDGRARSTTLYLNLTNEQMERSEGPLLGPGANAEGLTGIDHVLPRGDFDKAAEALAGRTIYVTVRGETVLMGTPDRAERHARAREADPWDVQTSREAWFRTKLAEKASGARFENLDDILDDMRMIKSPREIVLLRESSKIAGITMMEAMRSAKPGMGDLVLFDYAPDFHYYTSDVTRMFPASGRFTADQRELYGIYVKLYQALMTSIRPGPTSEILTDAVKKMDAAMASHHFTNAKNHDAAARFVDGYRTRLDSPRPGTTVGHMVGMEVHDVQKNFTVYQPGMVLTIEPALTIPEDRVYIRLEDMLLITATGYENMSGFAPIEMDAIEKLMAEPGIAQLMHRPASTVTR